MEKKTMTIIAAVVIVVIVVAGVFALTMNNGKKAEKTIYWTTIAPGLQKQAIADGTVAGGVSWEPYVSAWIS